MAVADMQPMILPVCFAEALRAVLKGEEEVEFAILGEDEVRRLRFSTPTFRLDCPLIGGAYPNYKAVIPETTAIVTMDTRALASAIDRMAIVSGPYVRLNFQPGTLTVTTVDEESSETIETQGDEVQLQVGFQAKLLTDSLVSITGEKVSISVNPEKENDSKLLFTNAGVNDGWKAVLMPARV
ncbi:DNA polymerase III subunit beta (plasmid) [Polaromonas sp. P1-6]|nr:DNA polymerase III subunit beta [Polaromonas sp. P1-6]